MEERMEEIIQLATPVVGNNEDLTGTLIVSSTARAVTGIGAVGLSKADAAHLIKEANRVGPR